jgi:hypothetical protein
MVSSGAAWGVRRRLIAVPMANGAASSTRKAVAR